MGRAKAVVFPLLRAIVAQVRGEYNGNYYVDLNAWRMKAAEGAAPAAPAAGGAADVQPAMPDVKPMAATPDTSSESDDDLPF